MNALTPILRTRRRSLLADAAMSKVFAVVGWLTVFLLIGIFVFLAMNGIGMFHEVSLKDFFLKGDWNPVAMTGERWGITGLVLGTLMISAGSLAVSVPFGLALAIYLSQLASPRMREILKPIIEMIAGIPSVVLGLIGLLYLAPLIAQIFHLSNGLNALTASILVGIAAVPTIASMCEDAISGVPRRIHDASLAMGATHWTTIYRVLVPAAASGIAASVMLGLGRAIGETMVVLMVAGNSLAMPHSMLDAVRPMTATIAIEIREVVVGDIHWQALFAIGFTLFLMTFCINLATDLLVPKRYRL